MVAPFSFCLCALVDDDGRPGSILYNPSSFLFTLLQFTFIHPSLISWHSRWAKEVLDRKGEEKDARGKGNSSLHPTRRDKDKIDDKKRKPFQTTVCKQWSNSQPVEQIGLSLSWLFLLLALSWGWREKVVNVRTIREKWETLDMGGEELTLSFAKE